MSRGLHGGRLWVAAVLSTVSQVIDRGRVAALPTGREAARVADSGRAPASYVGCGRPLPGTALLVGERGDRLDRLRAGTPDHPVMTAAPNSAAAVAG